MFDRANSQYGNQGNPPTLKHIQSEITRCNNFVRDIEPYADVCEIRSDDIIDFKEFGKNVEEYTTPNIIVKERTNLW